jgi:G3E family GTPase
VCCQLSDELRDTLQMLRERVQPDRIIVETSGVALPSDTQLHFWREPVSTWVEDDMAVVVVSAEQMYEGHELQGTFEDQVSSADLLLLNKIDLVPQPALGQLQARLHTMAPGTPVVQTMHSQIAPALLFPPDPEGVRMQRRQTGREPTVHHHEAFVSSTLAIEDGIAPEVLMGRLRELNVLRAKGFVRTSHGLRCVQGVGRRLELTEVSTPPPATLIGRVVVITRAPETSPAVTLTTRECRPSSP